MGLKAAWNALLGRQERPSKGEPKEQEPTQREAETLVELAQQVNGHHAELAQLRLEWAETLDKLTAWSNRQAARDRVRMKRAMAAQDDETDDGATQGAPEHFQGVSGEPDAPPQMPNGYRHPKADLYARIRR